MSYIDIDIFQEGGNLTRRKAISNSNSTRGYTREQARRAYRNAKDAVARQGTTGRAKRQAARHMISDPYPGAGEFGTPVDGATLNAAPAFDTPVKGLSPATTMGPVLTGPAPVLNSNEKNFQRINKPKEAIISTGDLVADDTAVMEPTIRQRTVLKPNPVIEEFWNPSDEEIAERDNRAAARRSKEDAWMQYQYERGLYDQTFGNYAPDQDSAAYQHWMWEDFNNGWNDKTNSPYEDYYMHSPTQEDLLRYQNAGQFMQPTLPLSRNAREGLGVDYNTRMFFNEKAPYEDGAASNGWLRNYYKAQHGATGIPSTNDFYKGMAQLMGVTVLSPLMAEQLATLISEAPAMYKAAVKGSKVAWNWFKTRLSQSLTPGLYDRMGVEAGDAATRTAIRGTYPIQPPTYGFGGALPRLKRL